MARVVLHLPDRTAQRAAEYGYDARGRLASVRDARGVAAQYAYDDEDRIVRDEKRGGSVYTVRYGRDGRYAYACGTGGYEERSLRYDKHAQKTWVTDSHGGVTVYEWNERGQVVKTTTPCGVVTRAEFDDRGRPVRQTLENGELREHAEGLDETSWSRTILSNAVMSLNEIVGEGKLLSTEGRYGDKAVRAVTWGSNPIGEGSKPIIESYTSQPGHKLLYVDALRGLR